MEKTRRSDSLERNQTQWPIHHPPLDIVPHGIQYVVHPIHASGRVKQSMLDQVLFNIDYFPFNLDNEVLPKK